jgi:hypothetical protein
LIFAGVDWAESGHEVHVQDKQGRRLAGGTLADGVEGIARFHDLVAAHAGEPHDVVIGIETDRGQFVAALLTAGCQVFAVNPMSVSRYRDRYSSWAQSQIRVMRRCWRTWSAPTGTTPALTHRARLLATG